MTDKLRDYETVAILSAELGEDGVNTLVEKLKDVLSKNGATFLREDRQGKKRLSFECKGQVRGNFVLLHYVGDKNIVPEIERTLRNADTCLRFLTTVNGRVRDIDQKRAEVESLKKEQAEKKAAAAQPAAESAAAPAAQTA